MTPAVVKPIIAIDIDDVLADSTESLRLLINVRAGANLQPEHYKVRGEYWGYYEQVWRAHGLVGRVNYDDIMEEMVDDQSHVPLLPGAALVITELAKRFNLVLITARESSWEVVTRRWLNMRLKDSFVDIYFTTSHQDTKTKNKGQLCRELAD